jgi:iron(III) transport system substrate-binding protein
MPYTQVTPKLALELRAGRNETDLAIVGSTTAILGLLPAKAIVPIRPFLVGPSTQDLSKWRNNRLYFADEAEQYNLIMSFYRKSPFVFNSNLVSGGEFNSYWDLLKPKWKGKIGMKNPNRAGGGQSNAVFWYTTDGLGKEFLRALFAQQEITIFEDDRPQLDFVAHGKHLVSIGLGDAPTTEAINKGLPIRLVDPARLKEGTYITAGIGGVVVIRETPHPNATKVYLNWLLSREAQTAWSKAAGNVSARRDVSVDHLPKEIVPEEGVEYQENHKEKYVMLRDDVVAFLKQVMKR